MKAEVPRPCINNVCLLYRRKIFVWGHNGDFRCFMTYDPFRDQWDSLSLPRDIVYASYSVVWKDRLLLCGQTLEEADYVTEQYDPDTDTWSPWEHQLPKQARYTVGLFAGHLSNRTMHFLKQNLPGQTLLNNDDAICSIQTLYDNVWTVCSNVDSLYWSRQVNKESRVWWLCNTIWKYFWHIKYMYMCVITFMCCALILTVFGWWVDLGSLDLVDVCLDKFSYIRLRYVVGHIVHIILQRSVEVYRTVYITG